MADEAPFEIKEISAEQFSQGSVAPVETQVAATPAQPPAEPPASSAAPVVPPVEAPSTEVLESLFKEIGVKNKDELSQILTQKKIFETQLQEESDEEILEIKAWKKTGKPVSEYYELKNLNPETLGDKEALWRKYLLDNPGLDKSKLGKVFEHEFKQKYNFDELSQDDQELAKDKFELEVSRAKKDLSKYREDQLKFDKTGIRSPKDEAERLTNEYNQHQDKVKGFMKDFSKAEFKATDIVEPFNFGLDAKIGDTAETRAQKVHEFLSDPVTFLGKVLINEKGEFDLSKAKVVAPFMADPQGFVNDAITFGINIGKKEMLEKKVNADDGRTLPDGGLAPEKSQTDQILEQMKKHGM